MYFLVPQAVQLGVELPPPLQLRWRIQWYYSEFSDILPVSAVRVYSISTMQVQYVEKMGGGVQTLPKWCVWSYQVCC